MTAAQQIIDPVYSDHIHAIRCALSVSAGAMGHATSKWQQECVSGYRVSSVGSDMTRMERFQQDCATRHMLHRTLTSDQWSVLLVRFAPKMEFQGMPVADRSEIEEMGVALDCLMLHLPHEISQEFTGWCLLRWAHRLPATRGEWKEWEGRTDLAMVTVRRRCYALYKTLNTIENAAKEMSLQLLRDAGLIV